jgi:hypothetical protein
VFRQRRGLRDVGRAAAEKLPVGRALLPVLCAFDGQECPSYW